MAVHRDEDWLVNLKHLDLFVRLADHLPAVSDGSTANLETLAAQIAEHPSAISLCLKELEDVYKVPLVRRVARRGIGAITEEGEGLRQFATKMLAQLKGFHDDPESMTSPDNAPQYLNIAATPNVRQFVLSGAMYAHLLRLSNERRRSAGSPTLTTPLRVDEGDFPQIITGVRHGRYRFGVGFQLPPNSYPDIDDKTVLLKDVGMIAIFPSEQFMLKNEEACADIMEILRQYPDKKQSLPFEIVQRLIRGRLGLARPVATVKTEYYPQLSELISQVDATKQHIVDRIEDVFVFVRCGLAHVGIVPEWYRRRRYIESRVIQKPSSDQLLTRSVVVYKSAQLSREAQLFVDTVKAYLELYREFVLGNKSVKEEQETEPGPMAVLGDKPEKEEQETGPGPVAISKWVDEKYPDH
jgi:DNA-binding transcriptional LysR family regulator